MVYNCTSERRADLIRHLNRKRPCYIIMNKNQKNAYTYPQKVNIDPQKVKG